jgi:magnesium-protoporphyrin O-methyltransferase
VPRTARSLRHQTPQYTLLKKVGELFPGPSKATRAYLHPEEAVRAALNTAGFKVTRSTLTAKKFYYSTLLEAVKQ